MEIFFVRTRHFYEPYIDFFKLVELSGFDIIYTDEVDVSQPGVFIVTPMNGEWRPHIDNQDDKQRNAHLILWNLERPSGSAGSVGEYGRSNRDLIYKRHVDEVWVSDKRLAEETQLRFVTLGSDYNLGEPSGDKKYDFVHMSYVTGRRAGIYEHFTNIAPNCWPPERHEVLRSSRFAVNIHQDIHPFQEPLRLALFAAYGIPVITEVIYDSFPWGDEFMIYSGYDGMVGKIRQCLEDDNYEKFVVMAMKARDRMCNEFRFKDMVEQAVKESVYSWR